MQSKETNEIKLSELEYRILQILKEDSRIPAAQIAKQLGLSRVTVSRIINSLKEKGIKFTVEFLEKDLVGIVYSTSCLSEECFKTISGDYISIIRANSLEDLEKALEKREVKNLIVARQVGNKITKSSLRCDHCGGKIEGEPIIYKRGRRIYYACCRTCLEGLKKKFEKKGKEKILK